VNISGLVEDSTLLVQVAELLSDGDISRALLNKTITVDVPLVSIQENSKCMQATCIIKLYLSICELRTYAICY
jgi:hypothetical protein